MGLCSGKLLNHQHTRRMFKSESIAMKVFILTALFSLSATSAAFGQGLSCSSATPLTGTGYWEWFQTGGNNAGWNSGPGCEVSSLNEFYFQWTAPQAGTYIVYGGERGGGASNIIAVASGDGCNAVCLDSAASESIPWGDRTGYYARVIMDDIQAGGSYLIRCGMSPNAHPDFGVLGIEVLDPACSLLEEDSLSLTYPYPESPNISDGTYLDQVVTGML